MTVGSKTLIFTYDASGDPQTVTYDGTTYYYTVNLQGDVVAILNSTGTTVVSYAYDAWGNILYTAHSMASTLGTHNPLLYRGYVYDHETGLYYLQSRYYNPKMGRFLNADTLVSTGQGLLGNNMFAYCLNNPSNFRDQTGYLASHILLPVHIPNTGNTIYESEEDAAFAAGVHTRNLTNSSNLEYICGIYRLDTGEYVVGGAFEGKHASASTCYIEYEKDGYSNWNLVAIVHSHPFCNGHIPNEFSTLDASGNVIGDLAVAAAYELPVYLAAPDGNLKVLIVYDIKMLPNNAKSFKYISGNVRNGLPVDDTMYYCR